MSTKRKFHSEQPCTSNANILVSGTMFRNGLYLNVNAKTKEISQYSPFLGCNYYLKADHIHFKLASAVSGWAGPSFMTELFRIDIGHLFHGNVAMVLFVCFVKSKFHQIFLSKLISNGIHPVRPEQVEKITEAVGQLFRPWLREILTNWSCRSDDNQHKACFDTCVSSFYTSFLRHQRSCQMDLSFNLST